MGSNLLWAKGDTADLVSLGGRWMYLENLQSSKNRLKTYTREDLYDVEPRTGIALDFGKKGPMRSKNYRTVREGHLYSFNHARLKPGIHLIFGVSSSLPLQEKGILKLGGEQRFGSYVQSTRDVFSPALKDSGHYLALSMAPCTEQHADALIATGGIVHLGGWDMSRGFHKPITSYYPAGTVFSKKISPNLISFPGGNHE
jgi:CRISPR-associated protein Cmr3